jgi:nucleoside-diphosphate-sugar epimerase
MGKRYLITGGTGFIGSALVKRLVMEGHEVRVFDNDSRGEKSRLLDIIGEITLIKGDIRDKEAVSRACKGVDSVIHLAYLNGTEFFYSKPEIVLDIGVKGIINVIDGCIKNDVKELVLASSSEVYQTPPKVPTNESAPLIVPDPLNPRYSYGAGKIISELLAINFGRKYFKKVLVFRPHNVYGPDMGWQHVIPQFCLRMKSMIGGKGKRLKFQIQGTGDETRSFIYIDDFIDGLMLVIKKGKHLNIYHIGTVEEVTIRNLAKWVAECLGKEVDVVKGRILRGSAKRRCPDISKLKKLGFSQKIPLKKGLRRTVEWYSSHEPQGKFIK